MEKTMQNRPIIIGVTGGSGGGKTSVSRAILDHFPNEKISMIEHDSYYKDQSHLRSGLRPIMIILLLLIQTS